MKLSFFTHSGGAGKIRGEQIASYLGANLNPQIGFENDICIYVKCVPPPLFPKKTYIDVVEDSAGLRWVKSHPEVGVIASSKSIYDYLSHKIPNKIVLIPQHHCNFERIIRTREKVEVAGIIGNSHSFQYNLEAIRRDLKKIGIELKLYVKKTFSSREEIVDFYKTIDIQLVWRPTTDGILRNPLKLINSSSFGIPTVSYPEIDFVKEFKDYFLEAESISDLVFKVQSLKNNPYLYESLSSKLLNKAEEYHISNISKLYTQLT